MSLFAGIKKSTSLLAFFLSLILMVLLGVNTLSHLSTAPAEQLAQSVTKHPKLQKPTVVAQTQYIQIIDGCSIELNETCVDAYTQPSENASSAAQLRSGTVLQVADLISENGAVWYKIAFDEWLRYPERVANDWYVRAEHVRVFKSNGIQELATDPTVSTTTKRIVIDRSEQMLYAYENEALFMQEAISSGLTITPTPRGLFYVYKKTPTRYMQGPIPNISVKYYDLPGVPWNLYFTHQGGVIHGTYWHEQFGKKWSNGCVNLPTVKAEILYNWADLGTPVMVKD